jgi:hypothetical protein
MAEKPLNGADEPPHVLDYRVLDYHLPLRPTPRYSFKYIAAGIYGFFAICLGLLLCAGAVASYGGSGNETTTRDRIESKERAWRGAACGGLLLISGAWYFRVGVRGDPAGRQD